MATLFVDKLDPQSGTALEIGSSGDTISVPSGATINLSNATQTGVGGDNTPYFTAYKSANSNISNETWTVIVCDTEKQDSASAYNTSTGIFTVPSGQGGKYYLEHGIRVEASTSQVDELYTYGETGVGTTQYWGNGALDFRGNAGQGGTIGGAAILTLAAGDTAKIKIYAGLNAGTPTITGNSFLTTWFLGYKLIT